MLIGIWPTWPERIEMLDFFFVILGPRVLRALSTLFWFGLIIFEVSSISTNDHPDDFSGLRFGSCSPSYYGRFHSQAIWQDNCQCYDKYFLQTQLFHPISVGAISGFWPIPL